MFFCEHQEMKDFQEICSFMFNSNAPGFLSSRLRANPHSAASQLYHTSLALTRNVYGLSAYDIRIAILQLLYQNTMSLSQWQLFRFYLIYN